MSPRGGLAVVISARNESDRIGATVRAAGRIPGVDIVVVVDDGSVDGTGCEAALAGATVVRHARNRGKAAAMETGAETVLVVEAERAAAANAWTGPAAGTGPAHVTSRPRHLLFLDADLAETAAQAGPLAEPVLAGRADMTIAVFTTRVKRGGHGVVLGLSGAGIERATGWRPAEPLNGQRCLTSRANSTGTITSALMTSGGPVTNSSRVALTPPSTELSIGTTARCAVPECTASSVAAIDAHATASRSPPGCSAATACSQNVPRGPR